MIHTGKTEQFLKAAAFAAALSVSGLHFSPALASIGTAAMLCLVLFSGAVSFRLLADWKLWLSLLVFWQLFIELWHGFPPGWEKKFLLKLPLFFLPVLSLIWRNLPVRAYFIAFIAVLHCWLSGASVLNYAVHYRFLNQMVLESKPLPLFSQVYHIEFSIMLAAVSLLGLLLLFTEKDLLKESGMVRDIILVATALNILFLHVLSVRTGMLAFWAGTAAGMIGFNGTGQRIGFRWLLAGMLLVIATAVALPSVRNRLVNTWDDLTAVRKGGDLNDKSFGRRWEAWKTGSEVVKSHPWAGVGMTGVEQALQEQFEKQGTGLHVTNRIMPHNQWLEYAMQSGLPAALIYLLFFVSAAVSAFRNRNLWLPALLAALFISGIFESYLERQAGVLVAIVSLGLAAAAGTKGRNSDEKNQQLFHNSI